MGLTNKERDTRHHAALLIGTTAVGKEAVARSLTGLIGGRVLITGLAARGTAEVARRMDLFKDCEDGPRLLPNSVTLLSEILRPRPNGLHFVQVPWDNALHIFYGKEDLTDALHPRFRREHKLPSLEPGAAVIATNRTLRRSLVALWRRTIGKENVTAVVGKRPSELLPESPLVVWMTADDRLSAGYRMLTGVNACDTYADELEYIRKRDGNHNANALDVVPDSAFHLDMNPYLMEVDGPRKAARLVFREYLKRLNWKEE